MRGVLMPNRGIKLNNYVLRQRDIWTEQATVVCDMYLEGNTFDLEDLLEFLPPSGVSTNSRYMINATRNEMMVF